MSLNDQVRCDLQGCKAVRRLVNHWYIVLEDMLGVHIYRWDKCPSDIMERGKHFCGLAHTMQYVSKVLTPDTTVVNRESTLELKPPLARDVLEDEAIAEREAQAFKLEEI